MNYLYRSNRIPRWESSGEILSTFHGYDEYSCLWYKTDSEQCALLFQINVYTGLEKCTVLVQNFVQYWLREIYSTGSVQYSLVVQRNIYYYFLSKI